MSDYIRTDNPALHNLLSRQPPPLSPADSDSIVQGFCGPATPGTRFLGQPVEELSRESLLAIIDWLGTKYIASLRSGVVEPVHQPVPVPTPDWGSRLMVGLTLFLCWVGLVTLIGGAYVWLELALALLFGFALSTFLAWLQKRLGLDEASQRRKELSKLTAVLHRSLYELIDDPPESAVKYLPGLLVVRNDGNLGALAEALARLVYDKFPL